jgi:hypothetical protein
MIVFIVIIIFYFKLKGLIILTLCHQNFHSFKSKVNLKIAPSIHFDPIPPWIFLKDGCRSRWDQNDDNPNPNFGFGKSALPCRVVVICLGPSPILAWDAIINSTSTKKINIMFNLVILSTANLHNKFYIPQYID